MSDASAPEWLIWSNEHEAWWRANSCGYTTDLTEAGSYSREEALAICAGAGHRANSRTSKSTTRKIEIPSELPVRAIDMLAVQIKQMERAIVR